MKRVCVLGMTANCGRGCSPAPLADEHRRGFDDGHDLAPISPPYVGMAMPAKQPSIDGMSLEQRIDLLQALLNDLHQREMVSKDTLLRIASDVTALDYLEDEELLCFDCLDEEIEEE